jgi:hypothetical protein
MFMIYHRAQYHLPISNGSLANARKPNPAQKKETRGRHVLILRSTKMSLHKFALVPTHTLFQYPKVNGAKFLAPQKILHPPCCYCCLKEIKYCIWRWNGLQWHRFPTKFRENRSNIFKVEVGGKEEGGQFRRTQREC